MAAIGLICFSSVIYKAQETTTFTDKTDLRISIFKKCTEVQGFSYWSYLSKKKRQAESILSSDGDTDSLYKLKEFLKAALQYQILILDWTTTDGFEIARKLYPTLRRNKKASFQCATSLVSMRTCGSLCGKEGKVQAWVTNSNV